MYVCIYYIALKKEKIQQAENDTAIMSLHNSLKLFLAKKKKNTVLGINVHWWIIYATIRPKTM